MLSFNNIKSDGVKVKEKASALMFSTSVFVLRNNYSLLCRFYNIVLDKHNSEGYYKNK